MNQQNSITWSCTNWLKIATIYGDMKTEMICDRLVVGIRDIVLSRHLQLDADLTLETA